MSIVSVASPVWFGAVVHERLTAALLTTRSHGFKSHRLSDLNLVPRGRLPELEKSSR
jgi:hypothetical protein